MKKEYSVSEAARVAHMTSETLRHYDRIGLVRPSRRDENTQYRYYTEEDIVRLCTVHTLQQMDLPLAKIKEVLPTINRTVEYTRSEFSVSLLTKRKKVVSMP